jgi:hypothetical protein
MTQSPTPLGETVLVRFVLVTALVAGAYQIVMRLPRLIEPTVLNEFPIVTTVLALFAYLTVAHASLSALAALSRRAADTRKK